jgi:hypothetical protein
MSGQKFHSMTHLGLVGGLGLILLSTSLAQAGPRPGGLISQWTRLNTLCRGGSGDDPKTMQACEARQDIGRKIDKANWCYGKKGQYAYQYEWHACVAKSHHSS